MKILRKKKIWIPLVIVFFLVLVRVAAPPIILGQINKKLEDFSPTLTAHVDDLDLSLIFGRAELEGISARVKDTNKKFLEVDSVDASIDMKEIFKGNVVARAVINKADFTYSEPLMKAVKEHAEQTKKDEEKPLPDIRVARVDLKDSVVRLEPYPLLSRKAGVVMSQIEARATNLIPGDNLEKTLFNMRGKLLKSGDVKVSGSARIEEKPLEWNVDSEILDFDLTTLNQFLKKNVPLTFTRGNLDFFMEAKSEDGKIVGYLKPFIEKLDVLKTDEEFKNTRHWIFEIITAFGNIVMQEEEVAATRVPFVFDETLQTDTGESIGNAFKHTFVKEISKGIENSIELK